MLKGIRHYKRVVWSLLTVCMILSCFYQNAYASQIEIENIEYYMDDETDDVIDEATAAATGSTRTANDVISQIKWSQGRTGHGFAAEQGNNYIDNIKGNNAIVVGDNNAKNGADRLIISRTGEKVFIQDKYYEDAVRGIDACFDENGVFRYVDENGNLMQIEVPKDQYWRAVKAMEKKIEEGKVPGATDPEEAKNLIRKGNLTYRQAVNLAKAGTVESLTYDATQGVVSAGATFGISTLLNYAVLRISGESREDALKESAISGVKAGVGVFCTAVIAGQLSKTGVMNVFKPSTEALTEALGEEFSESLIKAFGENVLKTEGESVAMSATKQAAAVLRSQALVAAVTIIVFTIPDAVEMFEGRISRKQFVKNFAVTATSVVAGVLGAWVGGVAGLAVPGVGQIPGSIVGAIVFGVGGGLAADKISDYITEDDADEMYDILEKKFSDLCFDYIVTEEEAQHIVDNLDGKLNEDAFKDMYQSTDRSGYAEELLTPLFEEEVAKRSKVDLPTEEEMRNALKEELQGVVFIH